jgi:hypothetical protein
MKKSAFHFAITAIICLLFYNCNVEPFEPTLESSNPILTTNSISNITTTSCSAGGNITSDGGSAITARGIVWSKNQNPTIIDSKIINGIGTGTFTSSITTLTANTTYYVRAFATNSKGTAYGNQLSFQTPITNSTPTLTTTEMSSITATSASGGGNITTDGGATITARGIVWSTSQNPTLTNTKTINGSGIGNFNSSLASLSENTTYYVRAYATNSNGTYYGNQVSFKTINSNANTTPTITTSAINSITSTTASGGGNITTDGGAAITSRGVVWSTSQNPTTSNSKTSNDSGIGTFSSSISMLSANTTYYVRAYATNSKGTYYGNQVVFSTATTTNIPTTSTNSFSAKLNGTNFVPTILFVQKINLTNSIAIVANRGGNEAISINFPSDVKQGTYDFDPFGTYVGQYTANSTDGGFAATSGTITISSHDITNKRVIGTFNFTATSFTLPTTHQISQGSFNIKY